MKNAVSVNFLNRLPFYLKALLNLKEKGQENVSSNELAKLLNLNVEQVKKDLQIVSSSNGKPKIGRNVNILIHDIETYLGYKNNTDVIVIGVGHLGQALLNYKGFNELGVNIQAGFDIDEKIVGQAINGKPIFHISKIKSLVPTLNARIAILTVPANAANDIAKELVKAGIKAIWNFCPIHLEVSNDIIVENVNLASSLAVISNKLRNL